MKDDVQSWPDRTIDLPRVFVLGKCGGGIPATRKLVEEIGLIYADNHQNPRGAEAIYQWVRAIPLEIYPGDGYYECAVDEKGVATDIVRAPRN